VIQPGNSKLKKKIERRKLRKLTRGLESNSSINESKFHFVDLSKKVKNA
jgi:hypothetical protein